MDVRVWLQIWAVNFRYRSHESRGRRLYSTNRLFLASRTLLEFTTEVRLWTLLELLAAIAMSSFCTSSRRIGSTDFQGQRISKTGQLSVSVCSPCVVLTLWPNWQIAVSQKNGDVDTPARGLALLVVFTAAAERSMTAEQSPAIWYRLLHHDQWSHPGATRFLLMERFEQTVEVGANSWLLSKLLNLRKTREFWASNLSKFINGWVFSKLCCHCQQTRKLSQARNSIATFPREINIFAPMSVWWLYDVLFRRASRTPSMPRICSDKWCFKRKGFKSKWSHLVAKTFFFSFPFPSFFFAETQISKDPRSGTLWTKKKVQPAFLRQGKSRSHKAKANICERVADIKQESGIRSFFYQDGNLPRRQVLPRKVWSLKNKHTHTRAHTRTHTYRKIAI